MNQIDLQKTEIYFFIALLFAGFILFLFYIKSKMKPNEAVLNLTNEKNLKPKIATDVLEVFDYLGTKIMHENGTYTVNFEGKVAFFKSWDILPVKFQKMVLELEDRSKKAQEKGDYFLEILNGVYKLTLPNGKTKKYKRLEDIPADIRKIIGK